MRQYVNWFTGIFLKGLAIDMTKEKGEKNEVYFMEY